MIGTAVPRNERCELMTLEFGIMVQNKVKRAIEIVMNRFLIFVYNYAIENDESLICKKASSCKNESTETNAMKY